MGNRQFQQQLAKQLGFLERSCASYDAGFHDEAIRIAVVARVLAHDTRSSVSLLTYMHAGDLLLRSTCPIISDQMVMFAGGLADAEIAFENGQIKHTKYVPNFGTKSPLNQFLPWKEWWVQKIYRLAIGDITRRDIVLGAANKDGGAHVDPAITSEYEALQTGIWKITQSSSTNPQEMQLPDAHLADLRQIAFEILNSPELLNLAAPKAV
jgi:hypothetical protein